jgi:hypothetical protein
MKIFEQRIGTVEKQMGEFLNNRSFKGNVQEYQENEFVQKNYNEIQNIKREMASQNNFLQSNVNLKHTDFKMTQGSQQMNEMNNSISNNLKYETMKSNQVQNNVFNQNLYNMENQISQDNLNNESININERVSENSVKRKFMLKDQENHDPVDQMDGSYEMDYQQN